MKTLYQVVATELVAGDILLPESNEIKIEAPTTSHRDACEQFIRYRDKFNKRALESQNAEIEYTNPTRYIARYYIDETNYRCEVTLKEYKI